MRNKVLLTVSGTIAPCTADEVARGLLPRRDYFELAHAFDAAIVDVAAAERKLGRLGRTLRRLAGPGPLLAWYCAQMRGDYDVIVSDGEQVGLPLALLFSGLAAQHRPRHLMIAHRLTVAKKARLLDRAAVRRGIDQVFVYASSQQRALIERWGFRPEQAILTPFMVDSAFFRPDAVAAQAGPQPMICAAGLEWRDYPTLMAAVAELPIDMQIAAASPWSKQADSSARAPIPANVTIKRLSQFALRQLYVDSAFVVMPLYEVDFQAGVTAILEAMAMGKAVICSRTSGQTDVIVDGEHGLYVPPGDPTALRAAITYLLEHPHEAARMGRAGRRLVEETLSLDHYTHRLAGYVRAARHKRVGNESLAANLPML